MTTQSATLLGARASALTLVGDQGIFVDPQGLINESETTETSYGAGLATDALGLVGTAQTFAIAPGRTLDGNPRVLVRAPWVLQANSAGAPFGTLRADLLINGVSVANALGAPRDLTAANGTRYVERIELLATNPWTLGPGQLIAVQLQPQITTASGAGGSTFEPRQRHDPQTIIDQLVVEIVGAAGAFGRS